MLDDWVFFLLVTDAALVVSDSLHIIFGMLEAFRNSFSGFYPDILLETFPWFQYPFYRITLCASINMMVAVAIERFLAVCFPHDYQGSSNRGTKRVLLYVLPAMSIAILINVSRFWETKSVMR